MSLDGIVVARPSETVHFITVSKYYQLASVLILVYDYLLTLDLEIEKIWRRPLQGSIVLFIINRYFPLLCYPVIIYGQSVILENYAAFYKLTPWSIKPIIRRIGLHQCETFLHFPLVMTVISDAIISAIVILRLYALYLGQWRVPIIICILAVVQFACGVHAITGVELIPSELGVNGCILNVKDGATDRFALLWSISVLFDCTAFILTLLRTLSLRPKTMQGVQTRLYDLLLRDGVMYFAVMFTAKLVNFIVFWTISRELITINWTFNHSITVIMISRLFLNLRAESPTPYASGLGTSTFRSLWGNVVGNLGAQMESDIEFVSQPRTGSPIYPMSPDEKLEGMPELMELYLGDGLNKQVACDEERR